MWDQYWSSGQGACCAEHNSVNYAEDFQQPWKSFFSQLKDSDRVLDLCTGNGAVMLIALERALEAGISVRLDGVDSAATRPLETIAELASKHAEINFHARTSVAELPFADDTFDYVSSQFGIEYTPLPQTSRELLRVLKPHGRAQFIMHAAAGISVKYAKRELVDIAKLKHEIGIFAAAEKAMQLVCGVERQAGVACGDDIRAASDAHDVYYEKLKVLGNTWQQRNAAAVFRDTGAIIQHSFQNRDQFPLDVLLDKLKETEESVDLHGERLLALIDSAQSSNDCGELLQRFLALGCDEATVTTVNDVSGDKLLGWRINIRK